MKRLLILLFLLPALAQSQTKQRNAEAAIRKFQQYYNAGEGDSIDAMFGQSWHQMKSYKPMWTKESNSQLLGEFGKLETFRFIGIDLSDPQKVYVFQTIFSKAGEKATSLTLDKEDKLSTFRFITESGGITQLLNKYHRSNTR